ncbi:MAG: substrate-binding domain-containing protein [Opitutaceae bacterium]|nr:substrate-binding domain-containing protein [Opitutaceae bacterium]
MKPYRQTMPFVRLMALGATLGCCVPFPLRAQTAAPAPGYQPQQFVAGTLRIWGHDYLSAVTQYWAEGFQRFHPGVRFEINLMGSATAIPGLYAGRADLAFLGRENNITDNNGFMRPLTYKPERFELTTGSLDAPGKAGAIVIFVHRDNPLTQLTLKQLDAIFGYERRRGAPSPIQTWDQMGLTGEWAGRPINLYTYDAETGTGLYFLHAVLGDSRKMNWERLKEFKDIKNSDGSVYRSAQQSLDALQEDRHGMAAASLRFATAKVKALALAGQDGSPYYQATRENLIARAYPLTRLTYAFINRPPGTAMDPKVKEFLRYIFSAEGQQDILRDRNGYLPLKPETLAAQRGLLE